MSQRLITIAQYRDLPTAGLSQSILESAGITCFLDNQFMIGINWLYSNALGGVKLQVLEKDVEQALKLLKDHSDSEQSDEKEEMDQLPPFVCPECGGREITTINYTRKFAALSLLFSLPLLFFAKRHVCKECGHKWK
jgi:Putative prokaryotic signal transducing protein